MKKFRPQLYCRVVGRLGPVGSYNWQDTNNWTIQNYLNKVWSVLHYRSSHAPEPIQIKWRAQARRFEQKHWKIL
ncbi:hypothetical protein EB118_16830 [bacterium]|nr:hypothetical protein [bacterium]